VLCCVVLHPPHSLTHPPTHSLTHPPTHSPSPETPHPPQPVVYNDGLGGVVGPEEFATFKTVEDLFVILSDAYLNNLPRVEVREEGRKEGRKEGNGAGGQLSGPNE
jgi:hypothetical protein